ncbi:MAG: BirA family biotin operon repressor/biotin-[acetyl-CoA-carboxylase] ligase [Candidatus Pseudothioglobus sp.]|jgi:BirA family biotin operon repressor/biotin-[acetyl-CoA-carboxylase] ligase
MSLEKLLIIMADGEFHSGDALGLALGVTRAAIWKQLKKVSALGIELTSIKGKGYRVDGGLDLLSEAVIRDYLKPQTAALLRQVELLGVVDSTNTVGMGAALNGLSGYVCSAEKQTAGRGRRGRSWASPFARNIYLSVVWEFKTGAAALEGLSLALGVAVVEALTSAGVEELRLKWPNDVVYRQQKLAGILVEVTGDAAGPCSAVVGIGLNVSMPEASAKDIDQRFIDVDSLLGVHISRSQLLALLLNNIVPLLDSFERHGFSSYRQRWQQLDSLFGQSVLAEWGDQRLVGSAQGVDDSGAYCVLTQQGQQRFSGGEVSLRTVGERQ